MADGWNGAVAATAVDITPARPLPLAGSAAASAPSIGVEDPLEASLLLLHADAPVLLVSVDALFVGPEVQRVIRDAVAGVVAPDAVLAFATHTHSAPSLGRANPRLGDADPAHVAEVAARIAAAAAGLVGRSDAVTLHAASERRAFGVCRRRRQLVTVRRSGIRFGRVVQGIDRNAPIDDRVVVARFDHGDGSPAAIVWSLACHPVGHPRAGLVSAHFPGVVRAALREALGDPHLPVLYLQGFSGDVRPRDAHAMRPSRSGRGRLAHGPGYSPFDDAGYADWCAEIATAVVGLAGSALPVSAGGVDLRAADLPRHRFVVGLPEGHVEFRSLRLGGFGVLGVSAEMVGAYADAARQANGAELSIVAGCLGDVPGYVPTARMLEQGGYEVEGFCAAFGVESVAPGVEAAVRDGLAAVAT